MCIRDSKSQSYRYRVVEATDQRCVIDYYEIVNGKMEKLGTSTYSIEEAKKAGLVRPNSGYEKNPSDMLFARAMGRGFRRFTPHLLSAPVYVEGEEWFDAGKDAPVNVAQPTQVEVSQSVKALEPPPEKDVADVNVATKNEETTEKIVQKERREKKTKADILYGAVEEKVTNGTVEEAVVEDVKNVEYIDVRKQRILRQTAIMNGWTEDMLNLFFKIASHDEFSFTSIDEIPVSEYQYLIDGLKDKATYNHVLELWKQGQR